MTYDEMFRLAWNTVPWLTMCWLAWYFRRLLDRRTQQLWEMMARYEHELRVLKGERDVPEPPPMSEDWPCGEPAEQEVVVELPRAKLLSR